MSRRRLGTVFFDVLLAPLHHPLIQLTVAYLIWGASAPVTKLVLRDITPSALLFVRMIIACLMLFPFTLRYRTTFTTYEQLMILLSAFTGLFLNIFLFYAGLPAIPSINAPIIGSIGPLILVLLARFVLHEKVERKKLAGVSIGLAGVLCVTVVPYLVSRSSNVLGIESVFGVSPMMGNIAMVLSTVAGVFGTIFLRQIKHIPGHVLAFWQCALTASCTFPFALSENVGTQLLQVNFLGVVGILYAAVLSSVVAYSLYNQSLHSVSASESGVFSYISPIAAVLLAIPLLSEYPNWWFLAGSVLIVAGVYVTERRPRTRPAHR